MLQDIAGRGLTHCAFLGWNTWGATPGVQHLGCNTDYSGPVVQCQLGIDFPFSSSYFRKIEMRIDNLMKIENGIENLKFKIALWN